MEMIEDRLIRADAATVWSAILNPEVLKACVPGCESMTGSPEEGFEATVVQRVGPVSARFTGAVTLSEMVAPKSLVITGEGKGGVAGFAKGGAKVRLEPEGEATRLFYEVEAKVGGKLAQLGSRIIDGFARKMADEFFTRFQHALEGPEEGADETAERAEGDVEGEGEGEVKKGWFRRLIG